MSILPLIMERAPSKAINFANLVVDAFIKDLGIEEMRNKRGADYDKTKYYQIRIKPSSKDKTLTEILSDIVSYLKSNAKKMGISRIQINELAFNSSKFSSVSFNYADIDFDIVVARGGNKGEDFEKALLMKMDNLIAGIDSSEEAEMAFAALEQADSKFDRKNVDTVVPRSGSTQRSGDMSPTQIGKIIADIIIKMKDGSQRYVSVKNKAGSTLAQFGISKAFNDDLTVNTNSSEWKTWLEPFGLDPQKLTEGLQAAAAGKSTSWTDIESKNQELKKTSAAYKVLEKMWGANYFYLREKSKKEFKAIHITPDFVHSSLLKGLKITEVRYPGAARKQVTIYLESPLIKYKLEVRNPRGKGDVRPTQIQLVLMKNEL